MARLIKIRKISVWALPFLDFDENYSPRETPRTRFSNIVGDILSRFADLVLVFFKECFFLNNFYRNTFAFKYKIFASSKSEILESVFPFTKRSIFGICSSNRSHFFFAVVLKFLTIRFASLVLTDLPHFGLLQTVLSRFRKPPISVDYFCWFQVLSLQTCTSLRIWEYPNTKGKEVRKNQCDVPAISLISTLFSIVLFLRICSFKNSHNFGFSAFPEQLTLQRVIEFAYLYGTCLSTSGV